MSGFPLFLGNDMFREHLRQFIEFPVKHTHIFDNSYLTIQHTFAVYGREGMRKAEVVRDFCTSIGVNSYIQPIIYGKTSEICHEMENKFKHAAYEAPSKTRPELEVIIIDHADILAFEPCDEYTVRFSLRLEEFAKSANFLVICCFDRTKTEDLPNPSRTAFFRQFPYGTVLSSPEDAEFRIEFYKSVIGSFCKQYAFDCALQDADYEELAKCSKWGSIDNMLDYCKEVFYKFAFDVSHGFVKNNTMTRDHFFHPSLFSAQQKLKTIPPNAQMLENKISNTVLGIMSAAPIEKPQIKKRQKIEMEKDAPPTAAPAARLLEEEEPPGFTPNSPATPRSSSAPAEGGGGSATVAVPTCDW